MAITTPVSLVDGSGLSPEDLIAPETLVRVLAAAASTPKLRGVITGLPVAGFTGTLSAGDSDFGGIGGIAGGAARGVVRAKTGNLSTVATLAGLVYDQAGDAAALRDHGAAGAGRRPATAGRGRDRRGGRGPGQVRVFVSAGSPVTISEHVR